MICQHTSNIFKRDQWRAGTGGLAGAEPLQLFGWGARNVFEPPKLEELWSAKK